MNIKKYQKFEKYRIYFIPAFLFVLSSIIIFSIIMPAYSNISTLDGEVKIKIQERDTLQTTLDVLSSQDDNKISRDFKTSGKALPATKDVLGIFTSLISSAGKSGIEISSFSLKPGKIISKKKSQEESGLPDTPFLLVKVTATSSDTKNFVTFINDLHETLPLAEVKKISSQKSDSAYEINFYYKSLDFAALSKQESIAPYTPQDEKLLRDLEDLEE